MHHRSDRRGEDDGTISFASVRNTVCYNSADLPSVACTLLRHSLSSSAKAWTCSVLQLLCVPGMTRRREKNMRRCKSARHAQRLLSADRAHGGHFQPRRHRLRAKDSRAFLQSRFQMWDELTGVK